MCFVATSNRKMLMREYRRKWNLLHPAARTAEHNRYYHRLKNDMLDKYGGECFCCGERNKMFLTFDHVNNDGTQCRKQLKEHRGIGLFRWAKQNNYPPTIQIACYNCNLGRAHNGGTCPHKVAPPS